MEMTDFSETGLARLLGLTIKDYKNLRHSPLMEYRNRTGVILEYFMHISPLNDPALLGKLKIESSNFMRFSVKQVMAVKKISKR